MILERKEYLVSLFPLRHYAACRGQWPWSWQVKIEIQGLEGRETLFLKTITKTNKLQLLVGELQGLSSESPMNHM